MVVEPGVAGGLLLVGRVLFGGILAFMGVNHFTNTGGMAEMARESGVPSPRLLVLFSGGQLFVGGLAILVGSYPVLGAGAVAVFLLVVTPTMHDFWTHETPERRQQEMSNFLRNAALLGAALAFLAVGGEAWPYALGPFPF